jgi:hypothetical protein
MTMGLDVLPGHTGICHRAPSFGDPEVERVAEGIEREYAPRFLAEGVMFRVVPIVIDFRARVAGSEGRASRFRRRLKDHIGEGVAVRLDITSGYRGDAPQWLLEAQADMIVRQRAESDDEWMPVRPLDMVESLLREQANVYLKELELDRGSPRRDAGADRVPMPRA